VAVDVVEGKRRAPFKDHIIEAGQRWPILGQNSPVASEGTFLNREEPKLCASPLPNAATN
jgi:hypothetical protein